MWKKRRRESDTADTAKAANVVFGSLGDKASAGLAMRAA